MEKIPITNRSRKNAEELIAKLFNENPMPIWALDKIIKEYLDLGLDEYAEEIVKQIKLIDPKIIHTYTKNNDDSFYLELLAASCDVEPKRNSIYGPPFQTFDDILNAKKQGFDFDSYLQKKLIILGEKTDG